MSKPQVARNMAVYFTYVVTTDDGKTMEQSDIPIGYVHGGSSGLLPKLERSLEGLSEGESLDVEIFPEDGFGESKPELIYREKIDNVPKEFRKVGAEPKFKNEDGEVRSFTVTGIEDGDVIMDGNHPYAGKVIIFCVTITEVRDAEVEEISNGRPKDTPAPVIH
ncbi:hypothetical protein MNBD_GAMMA12-359 [hydrothermal vent metagenome]|uniref:peptidylprolyl isomerase n=1 Tax=hydrothermal vent metagenome TaxID=652676 RepID=A0A3B0YDS8_9ZZZZ